jgi:hypothetical protein
MRPTVRLLPRLALAALAFAAAPVSAAPPEPAKAPAAAASGPLQLGKGDVVVIDLSHLPDRLQRRGTAVCVGLVPAVDKVPQEKRCEQPFTYEVPLSGPPIVLSFEATKGYAKERIELPLARAAEPRRFTAPDVGTFAQVPTPAGAQAASEQGPARTAAAAACKACTGAATPFQLREFSLTDKGPSALDVRITVERHSKP